MTDWDRLFDELYLKTYAPLQRDDDAETLALGVMRLIGCDAPADVLDAACGYGRHSRALARAGYTVVGLDRSPVLLAEARRRSEGGEGVVWMEGDYRELPFPAGSFDVVVNLFTSFGFFGDEGDARVLAEFRRVLRPGGVLVVETLHRDRFTAIPHEQDWEDLPDGAVRLDRHVFDPVNGVVEAALTYRPRAGEAATVEYRLRVYAATELARMAAEAGFAETAFYGGPDGGPLTRESRLVLVARTA
ncbi:MAG TPA: methyltransferase domain-containing protein [Gaiellaceae bacterium]|jgi:SAM-dependent methyltransferase